MKGLGPTHTRKKAGAKSISQILAIDVRELKTEFNHRFGVKYAVRISQVAATRIVGARNVVLPRMGYELRVAEKDVTQTYRAILYLENCSGDFFLTCASEPRENWKEMFNCTVKERKND
jgi:hypothetical protein